MGKCNTCKHKTTTSESELYCVDSCYGLGHMFDWCKGYNDDLYFMEHLGFDFDKCPKYERK